MSMHARIDLPPDFRDYVLAADWFRSQDFLDVVIGIDPGVTGAISVIDRVSGYLLWCADLPLLKIKRQGKKTPRPEIDLAVLRVFLSAFSGRQIAVQAVIENIWGRRGNVREGGKGRSPSTAGTLMNAQGQLVGILVGLGIPYRKVTPNDWKKWARISGPDGDLARRRAGELFPMSGAVWPLKRDHNRAESALIAGWGRAMIMIGR